MQQFLQCSDAHIVVWRQYIGYLSFHMNYVFVVQQSLVNVVSCCCESVVLLVVILFEIDGLEVVTTLNNATTPHNAQQLNEINV